MDASEVKAGGIVKFDYPSKDGTITTRQVMVLDVYDGRFRGEAVDGHESRKGTAYGMFSFDKIENLVEVA